MKKFDCSVGAFDQLHSSKLVSITDGFVGSNLSWMSSQLPQEMQVHSAMDAVSEWIDVALSGNIDSNM